MVAVVAMAIVQWSRINDAELALHVLQGTDILEFS
jgi:hypothetical protein